MNIKRTVPLVKDIKKKIHSKTSLTKAAKAMGYTEGATLRRVFREGEMPIDRLFALANLLDVSMDELVDHSKPLNNDTYGFMRWCLEHDKKESKTNSYESTDFDFEKELPKTKSVLLAYALIADYANAVGKRPEDVFDVLGMMYEAMFSKGD